MKKKTLDNSSCIYEYSCCGNGYKPSNVTESDHSNNMSSRENDNSNRVEARINIFYSLDNSSDPLDEFIQYKLPVSEEDNDDETNI